MRKILLILSVLPILSMGGQNAFCQERPYWTNGYFYDAPNSYIEVVEATSWSVTDAERQAEEKIIKRRSLATGTNSSVSFSDGKYTVESNHNLIVKSMIRSEYVEELEPGLYKVYLLVQTVKNPKYEYESVSYSDKYPFSARSFVPGWQQIYKGSQLKGGIIIGAEALGVAGIVTCFSMKSSYEKLIQEDPKHTKEYSTSADTWQNVGYGCIAFAAVVYIYNIIDATVAPGKKSIFVNGNIAFSPIVTNEGSACLAIRYNF